MELWDTKGSAARKTGLGPLRSLGLLAACTPRHSPTGATWHAPFTSTNSFTTTRVLQPAHPLHARGTLSEPLESGAHHHRRRTRRPPHVHRSPHSSSLHTAPGSRAAPDCKVRGASLGGAHLGVANMRKKFSLPPRWGTSQRHLTMAAQLLHMCLAWLAGVVPAGARRGTNWPSGEQKCAPSSHPSLELTTSSPTFSAGLWINLAASDIHWCCQVRRCRVSLWGKLALLPCLVGGPKCPPLARSLSAAAGSRPPPPHRQLHVSVA